MTRAGRFDRTIEITLPEKNARKHILGIHLKKITLQDDIETLKEHLANVTPGFSGADLENLCNEAAIFAARDRARLVKQIHFDKALDRIIGGLETYFNISKKHKERIACYESGKAITSWFAEHVPPILKISIIPRSKNRKGYSFYLNKDVSLQTRIELVQKIAFTISGKIAEEEILKESSTKGQEDLLRAYEIA